MRSPLERLKNACPDIEEPYLSEHVKRLGERYFKRFTVQEIGRHIRCISRLSSKNPIELMIERNRDGSVDCTALASDYAYEFSLITGIFASMGFEIISGDVFTYARRVARPAAGGTRGRGQARWRPAKESPGFRDRRRIIDHFTGTLRSSLSFRAWSEELRGRLAAIGGLLEDGDGPSIEEARHRVGEWVVGMLERMEWDRKSLFAIPQIEFSKHHGDLSRIKVVSQDTPAFLYALSNALSCQDIFIEHVRIRTIHGRVEDEIDVVDSQGRSIEDRDQADRIKLSVLLTKQFTYFLVKAPNPSAALARFESILKDVLRLPEQGKWMEMLSNPHTMRDLARLLGTSDFLWEDFIRLHVETLLPMLTPRLMGRRLSEPIVTLEQRLDKALEQGSSLQDWEEILNRFKDREIFLMDLDHILNPEEEFRRLSERLTALAECIINKAATLIYDNHSERYGIPRTQTGDPASYAILGMGKLGGGDLGYASDIELQFIYSGPGNTDGRKTVKNAEFFQQLVQETARFIHAKREGIFQVDLRLRPHGASGPLAVSLDGFRRYYGPGGKAHSFERLALVRMRPIGGDPELCRQVNEVRDHVIYEPGNIDISELRTLRERQFKEKTKDGLNAKYSPGGLVDVEYGVQVFQVLHGISDPLLGTPRIHEAIDRLAELGILDSHEGAQLLAAYDFLRNLINGMRMLRGSAQDLFLPSFESDEFVHLARRMGYSLKGALAPDQQLHIDFEMHTAAVRGFYERHFGREALPDPMAGTMIDLIISEGVPKRAQERILKHIGFRDSGRAYHNLKSLAGEPIQRKTFARLAVLAQARLRESPDPDMALNHWERYIRVRASPEFHYKVLLEQPMRMEILLGILSSSHFLSDTLVRYPGFLDWVMAPEILHGRIKKEDLIRELKKAKEGSGGYGEWLNKLRRFRRREILRIGARDICLGSPMREIMSDLSILAETLSQAALDAVWEEEKEEGRSDQGRDHFCVLAFGKLGGDELNYSSDIDLLGVSSESSPNNPFKKEGYARVMSRLQKALSSHGEEGVVYRVDLRLRPFGPQGDLVPTIQSLLRYYERNASLWEVQAVLKLRPIAGNLLLGEELIKALRPTLLKHRSSDQIRESIIHMRRQAADMAEEGAGGVDVKNGRGGLRDIEFLIQGLQLIHARNRPELIEGNTLRAADLLEEAGLLPQSDADQLKKDYFFLRHIEHNLQILDDRQTHSVPKEAHQIDALAKRVFRGRVSGRKFMDELRACMQRVHRTYARFLVERSE